MPAPADTRISDERLEEILANGVPPLEWHAIVTELRERRAQAVTVDRYGAAINGWLESMENAGSWDAATLERLRENIGPILDEMAASSPPVRITDEMVYAVQGVVRSQTKYVLSDETARFALEAALDLAAPPPAQAAGVTEALEEAHWDGMDELRRAQTVTPVAWGAPGLSCPLAGVSLERYPGFNIPLYAAPPPAAQDREE